MTVAQLKQIWEPDSTVKMWADVNPAWPAEPIKLFGPGTDSGTFEYFTEEVCGKARASRPDYTANENDNVLVTGVAGEKYALGYFGYAYYVENKDKVKIVPIDSGTGPVTPNDATITSNAYTPLSRPLFIYVNIASLERAEVKAFAEFYMENGEVLVHEVGYTPLDPQVYEDNLTTIKNFP
jgi:phosphate transport system substrate-binding protein